jgi:O-antigen/teichoic acid export membrane protein
LKRHLGIPLYVNSYYLISRSALNVVTGFVFWALATHSYSANDVGTSAAIISAVTLLISISNCGFGFSIIRFLPNAGDGARLVNFCLTVTGILALISGSIFVLGISIWSPSLLLLRQSPVYLIFFLAFTVFTALGMQLDQTLIAKRSSKLAFIKNLIGGVAKIVIVICLAKVFSNLGIFTSFGLSGLLGFLIGLIWFLPMVQTGYKFKVNIKVPAISKITGYSLGNYAADLLSSVPVLIFPLIVINALGAQTNAYFYIAQTISNALVMIPQAISTSLFVEGTYQEDQFMAYAKKSIILSYSILLPLVVGTFIFGQRILSLFGSDYGQNGTFLLQILACSAIPFVIISVYISQKRIKNDIKSLLFLSIILCSLQVAISYLLMKKQGVNGIGIGCFVTYLIIASIIAVMYLFQTKKSAAHSGHANQFDTGVKR